MYVPEHFREDDPAVLAETMRRHPFAMVVSSDVDGVPFASHLPLLYDAGDGPHGTLHGHMARANPQWRQFAAAREVLAVFAGPHAYVSPSWYATHPAVPTWNYVAVHAYGRPQLVDGHDAARALLARLVATYEGGMATPWRMELPQTYEQAMIRGIVAFRLELTRLEGKFKLSQNRDATDRGRVAAALAAGAEADGQAVAALMRTREAASD